jgi:hypothetical protein
MEQKGRFSYSDGACELDDGEMKTLLLEGKALLMASWKGRKVK